MDPRYAGTHGLAMTPLRRSPSPSDEMVRASRRLFQQFAPRDARLLAWRHGDGYVAARERNRYRRMTAGARRVLDLGCGTGEAARWSGDAWYVGIDESHVRLRVGLDRGGRALAAADLAHLPFADASFDRVICVRTLHHLPHGALPAAVAEMARVLEPGGRAFLLEPNPGNSLIRAWNVMRPTERGIFWTGPREIRRAVRAAPGLRIERFEYEHTLLAAGYLTVLLADRKWASGPAVTALLVRLHRLAERVIPPRRWSGTFWELAKR